MKAEAYATEAALCADFLAWVKAEGGTFRYGIQCPVWTAYAETAGWDILLVAEDGTQIGVQAKLKFNMKVLTQAVPDNFAHWHDQGPDYRAVLVPDFDHSHAQLCAALGLMLIAREQRGWGGNGFTPSLNLDHRNGGWHYWNPKQRCELPEFVPDVIAGSSAPVQLTKWKIAALRIIALLEVNGHVTRADFRNLLLDPRRWVGPNGWLKPGANPGEFVRGDGLDFEAQHPDIYRQVLEEARAKQKATTGQQALV